MRQLKGEDQRIGAAGRVASVSSRSLAANAEFEPLRQLEPVNRAIPPAFAYGRGP